MALQGVKGEVKGGVDGQPGGHRKPYGGEHTKHHQPVIVQVEKGEAPLTHNQKA